MKIWNLKIHTVTWPYEYGHLRKEDPSAWIWMVSYSVNSVRSWCNCLLILSLGTGCRSYFISVSFARTLHDLWEHFPFSYWAPHSPLFSRYRGLSPRRIAVGDSSYPLTPFSAEVENEWRHTSTTPYAFMICTETTLFLRSDAFSDVHSYNSPAHSLPP